MNQPAEHSHHPIPKGPERDRVLTMIALLKFGKAVVVSAVGFGALQLIHSSLRDQANAMFDALGQSVDVIPILKLLREIGALGPTSLRLFGAGAFLYAALFITEGVGLWLQKRWAEYLTVAATASFIPFEIFEIVKLRTFPRIAALTLNVLVVIYLIYRINNPTPWQVEELDEKGET